MMGEILELEVEPDRTCLAVEHHVFHVVVEGLGRHPALVQIQNRVKKYNPKSSYGNRSV